MIRIFTYYNITYPWERIERNWWAWIEICPNQLLADEHLGLKWILLFFFTVGPQMDPLSFLFCFVVSENMRFAFATLFASLDYYSTNSIHRLQATPKMKMKIIAMSILMFAIFKVRSLCSIHQYIYTYSPALEFFTFCTSRVSHRDALYCTYVFSHVRICSFHM